MVAKGKVVRRGKDWKFWTGRWKLRSIGWVNSKVLQYSTHYRVMNHNEKKKDEKEYIDMTINHFAV